MKLMRYKLLTLTLVVCLSISTLSGCNSPTENGEADTGESGIVLQEGEVLATLPDGYTYGEDGQIYDANGNLVEDPSTILGGTASGVDNLNITTWTTLYGDTVESVEGVATFKPAEGSPATEYGYPIFETEGIKVYLNNFIRAGGDLELATNKANSGVAVLAIENNTGEQLTLATTSFSFNDIISPFESTAYTSEALGYVTFPWVADTVTPDVIQFTKILLDLSITVGESAEPIQTGSMDITEYVNNLTRLIVTDSDNVMSQDNTTNTSDNDQNIDINDNDTDNNTQDNTNETQEEANDTQANDSTGSTNTDNSSGENEESTIEE